MVRALLLGVLLAARAALAVTGGTGVTITDGTVRLTHPAHGVDARDSLACDGATDDRATLVSLLAGDWKGKTIDVTGCKIGLGGTGASTFTAIAIPSDTRFVCSSPADAGFVALGKVCVGGNSPGAACATSAECDGGTCSGSQFCPSGSDTCTLLGTVANTAGTADHPPRGQGIVNCGIWLQGWDPYYRCASGGDAGKPCLQRCTGNRAISCDQNADCTLWSAGTCEFVTSFCAPSGDTSVCSAEPGRPSGSGKVQAIDFDAAADTEIRGVVIYDARHADFLIRGAGQSMPVGNLAQPPALNAITDVDTTRLSLKPTYPIGLETDTYATSITGTITTGVQAAAPTTVTRLRTRAATTGISLTGADSGVDVAAVRVTASSATGISTTGTHAQIRAARVDLTAASQTGISTTGADTAITFSRVTGSNHTGQTGIQTSGGATGIERTKINLPNTTSGTAVKTLGAQAKVMRSDLTASTYGIWATGPSVPTSTVSGCEFSENDIAQAGSGNTVGIYLEGCVQTRVRGNDIAAVFNPILVDGLMANTTIEGNRLRFGTGPKIILNGAGNQVANNYLAWSTGSGRGIIEMGGSTRSQPVQHNQIRNNIFYSETAGAECVRFVDFGTRCTGGTKIWQACTNDNTTDCPGATCGDCCATQQHVFTQIDGNNFLNCDVGVELAELTSGNVTIDGLTVAGNAVAPAVDLFVRYPSNTARCGDTCDVVGNLVDEGVPDKLSNWADGQGVVKGNTYVDAGDPADEVRSDTSSGDRLNLRTFQASVATTNATVTTLFSYTVPSSKTVLVRALVVARRTGGSSGVADDGAGYLLAAVYKNGAQIGTTSQTILGESQAGWDATLDFSTSTARVRVTGATNNNVTWHTTVDVQEVGT